MAVPSRFPRRVTRLAAAMLLAAAAATAIAASSLPPLGEKWNQWEIDFDEDRKPWKEIEGAMPGPPRETDLVAFDGGGATQHRFYLDARSVSVGGDGVVRYTLVVKAGGGATNVTFEGIRCETREQKYYAIGRPDGQWVRARGPQWRVIQSQKLNRHHELLYANAFCHGRQPVKTADEAMRRLNYEPPTVE